jgi:hypothetical protein
MDSRVEILSKESGESGGGASSGVCTSWHITFQTADKVNVVEIIILQYCGYLLALQHNTSALSDSTTDP